MSRIMKPKPLEGMALFDNVMFGEALKGRKKAVAEIAQVVLDDPGLTVEKVWTEYSIENFGQGSVRLDILAVDGRGRRINIEFQKDSRGAGVRRACRNASLIASELARAGLDPDGLPEVYVICFTERDYWKLGQAIYYGEVMMGAHADPRLGNAKEIAPFEVDDGVHIRYVNCQARKDTNTLIGRLLHDLFSTASAGMFFPHLKRALHDCKETPEGRRKMENVIEAYVMERQKEAVINFLAMGLSMGDVAKGFDMPIAKVEEMAEEAKKGPLLQ